METNNVLDSHPEPLTEAWLLAVAGIDAEAVYEGDAHGCPHCMAEISFRAA